MLLTCFVLMVRFMLFELLASFELICPSRLSMAFVAAVGLPVKLLA
jgi:hypothetical protein